MTFVVKFKDMDSDGFFEFDTREEAEEFMKKVTAEHRENDEFFGRTEPSLRCLKLFKEE